MRASRCETPTQTLLAQSGKVRLPDVTQRRQQLVDALDDAARDPLVDAHAVTTYDAAAVAGLAPGRSRKARQHRMVVFGDSGGPLARSRTGLVYRMPVCADAAAAGQALSAVRAGTALRSGAFGEHRGDGPVPTPLAPLGAGSRS